MLIRPARPDDAAAIWRILEPIIRAGETYALDRDLGEEAALAYWMGCDRETFVAEADGIVVGTYYLRANQQGGGAHVGNCGYATGRDHTGRGIARAMCRHSLARAAQRGFRAMQFNFVIETNTRAVALWHSEGFRVAGRLPAAFRHPCLGFVDVLVMTRPLAPARAD